MRNAGLAERLVGAADFVDHQLAYDRRARRGQHDDLQAVGEREAFGGPPADGQKLGECRRGR
jgi:hypothetical protein